MWRTMFRLIGARIDAHSHSADERFTVLRNADGLLSAVAVNEDAVLLVHFRRIAPAGVWFD